MIKIEPTTWGVIDCSDIQAGTLLHERGGLEADVSAYNGLLKISGGSTSAITDNSTTWDAAQAGDAGLTSLAGLTYVSDSMIKITATDTYAVRTMSEVRTDLGLVIGTNVQAWDADLDTYAGITPSANVQTLLGAATFAAFKTSLSLGNVEDTAISTYKLDDLATPDNNTDLDFNTTEHGLVPRGTNIGNYLKDDGTWAAVAGGGDVTAGANITANSIVIGDDGAKGVKLSTGFITDAGEAYNASQPAFLAYNSVTDLNVTGGGTVATVDFDTEVFDQGGDFAADTFTAPIDGRFLLTARVWTTQTAGSYGFLTVVTSNRTYYSNAVNPGVVDSVGGEYQFLMSTLVDMDANDTAIIQLTISGAGGDTVDISGFSSPTTYFSGALLC